MALKTPISTSPNPKATSINIHATGTGSSIALKNKNGNADPSSNQQLKQWLTEQNLLDFVQISDSGYLTFPKLGQNAEEVDSEDDQIDKFCKTLNKMAEIAANHNKEHPEDPLDVSINVAGLSPKAIEKMVANQINNPELLGTTKLFFIPPDLAPQGLRDQIKAFNAVADKVDQLGLHHEDVKKDIASYKEKFLDKPAPTADSVEPNTPKKSSLFDIHKGPGSPRPPSSSR